jgi:hypothetical protein
MGDVEAEQREQEMRRLRKQIAAAERAAGAPPRLGKHKYVGAACCIMVFSTTFGLGGLWVSLLASG